MTNPDKQTTTPKPCTMPEEIFLQRWRRKPDGADIFGFSFQPENNEPNTRYVRADLVEKMEGE